MTTQSTLAAAELERLVDDRADAELFAAERLRPLPAPDLLVTACLRVGVLPAETVTFTHTPAGVAAGRAAGLEVIGVGTGQLAEILSGFGAGRVVSSLADLLDPRLRV
jgi:beta-phosphoglucomutase-like phosphatase (HAD superfamily)